MRRLERGDVVTIPIDQARVGCGQVVELYGEDAYYFAIFDSVYASDAQPSVDEIVRDSVAFLGLSLDARVASGDWHVIGQTRPAPVGLPWYKEAVAAKGSFVAVDATGSVRRPASQEEVQLLPFRQVVAPIRLERALRARHGLEPWLPSYNNLMAASRATHG